MDIYIKKLKSSNIFNNKKSISELESCSKNNIIDKTTIPEIMKIILITQINKLYEKIKDETNEITKTSFICHCFKIELYDALECHNNSFDLKPHDTINDFTNKLYQKIYNMTNFTKLNFDKIINILIIIKNTFYVYDFLLDIKQALKNNKMCPMYNIGDVLINSKYVDDMQHDTRILLIGNNTNTYDIFNIAKMMCHNIESKSNKFGCYLVDLIITKKYNKFYDDPAIIQIQINMMCEEIKFIINDDEKYKKFIESYCYNLDLREPKYEKNLNKDYLLEPLFTYMLCAHNNIDRMIKIKNVILTEYKYWIFECMQNM